MDASETACGLAAVAALTAVIVSLVAIGVAMAHIVGRRQIVRVIKLMRANPDQILVPDFHGRCGPILKDALREIRSRTPEAHTLVSYFSWPISAYYKGVPETLPAVRIWVQGIAPKGGLSVWALRDADMELDDDALKARLLDGVRPEQFALAFLTERSLRMAVKAD